MKTGFKLSLVAGLLAVASLAYSQGPRSSMWHDGCDPAGAPYSGMMGYGMQDMRQDRMGKMDPARMQERMQAMQDKRHAALKAQLKLTPEQEGAWTAFVDSARPGGQKMAMQRPDPAELAKLSTPERLDKMKALRDERMKTMTAAMDKHMEATKAFYAALTPEQQKVFDTHAMTRQGKGARR